MEETMRHIINGIALFCCIAASGTFSNAETPEQREMENMIYAVNRVRQARNQQIMNRREIERERRRIENHRRFNRNRPQRRGRYNGIKRAAWILGKITGISAVSIGALLLFQNPWVLTAAGASVAKLVAEWIK
jgi:hypothetical protein